jgi:hypothetical protein
LNSDIRFYATDKPILGYLAGTRGLVAVYLNRLGNRELRIHTWWSSRQISKRLSRVYLAYTQCDIFFTDCLRYHYTVDLVAGALLAAVLIVAEPLMYRKLSGRADSIGA